MEAASAAPAADKRRHPFPWLNLMATEPFYLLHFLLFFSYLGARSSASQTLSADLVDRLFRREIQAILAFLVLVAVKMVKEETWEAFVANTLLYAKGFLFAIALVIDSHLALCYLLGFLGNQSSYLAFWHEKCFYLFYVLGPKNLLSAYKWVTTDFYKSYSYSFICLADVNFISTYADSNMRIKFFHSYLCLIFISNRSLFLAHILAMRIYTFSSMKLLHRLFRILSDNDAVFYFFCLLCLGDCSQLTPLQLESLLTEGSTSRFWLVEFRALCSSTCVQKCRIFPDLSIIYSNKNISFGVVDIGHFPNAAEKFGISLPGQIPTYILFENAVEVARLPEFSYTEASVPTISKKFLCQHFELDRRLIQYVSE
ncbi:unnamed protein product [Musa banksii]